MGRYYDGDIEGKFWFGVQPSDDADFFGVIGETCDCDGDEDLYPDLLCYTFTKENIKDVKAGIKKCIKELGSNKKKLDDYFDENNYYTDKELTKVLNVKEDEVLRILQWYARLDLGNKILKHLLTHEECRFEAEC